MLLPSSKVNEQFRTWVIETARGEVVTGLIRKEDRRSIHMLPNLLIPDATKIVRKKDIEFKSASKLSSMPEGLVNVMTKTATPAISR